MSGYRERSIYYAEGFGYTTAELRKLYRFGTAASTVTMDTTTIPGRNFVRVPAGQYLDINFPNFGPQYTEFMANSSRIFVIQGKVYIDAASYTNVAANRFLFEISASDGGFTGFGISPNSAVNQDNWYIKFGDGNNDFAINVVAGALPVRTVKDVKLMLRITDSDDNGQAYVYIDDVLVARTAIQIAWMDIGRTYMKGFRIWGLADQTGETLWGDLIAYSATYISGETLPVLGDSPASTIGPGTSLLSKDVRVLDLTPDTTEGGINDFDVVGTGDPITALSSMDSSTYVVSSDYDQRFMLKPKLPPGYNDSFDGSTLAPYNHNTPVHGFNYMTWTKDLNLSENNVRILVRDDATAYRFRYYRLHLSGNMSTTGGTLNRITFMDANLTPIALSGSATMRLNRILGSVDAIASETSGATNNAAIHTAMLNASAPQNIYSTVLNFTGVDIRNDGYIAEYLIDFGEGNIAPNWYAIVINQTGASTTLYNHAVTYGSTDGFRWYHLVENHVDMPSGDNSVSYLFNRRHPEYASTQFKQRAQTPDFVPNGAQFEPLQAVAGGDVIAARASLPSDRGLTRTPIPLGQFKDYKIGLHVVEPYAILPVTNDETIYVSFAYDNFASTTDLNIINAYVDGNNSIVLSHYDDDWGNLARTVKSAYNKNWSMSWRVATAGTYPSFSLNWSNDYNNFATPYGYDHNNIEEGGKIDGSRHSIIFLAYDSILSNNRMLRWLQSDGNFYQFFDEGNPFPGTKYFWMDYDHSDSTLAIYVSGTSTKPATPYDTLTNFYFADDQLYNVAFGGFVYSASGPAVRVDNWSLVFKNTDGLVTDGLILFLDAGDTYSYNGGTTWTDLSGYGHNATLINGPTFSSANQGSITFDGDNDYVSVTETAALRPQILTLDITFRVNGTLNSVDGFPGLIGSTNTQFIAYRQNSRTPSNLDDYYEGFAVTYYEDTKRVRISTTTSAGTQYSVFNTTDINVGDICTITAVFDNTTMSIYRDGVFEASAAKAAGLDYNGAHALKFGRAVIAGDDYDAMFEGDIYNVKMYDRALTASEILQNYTAYGSRYSVVKNGLILNVDAENVASYPGSGSTWYDVSGQGNDLEIIGPDYVSYSPAHFSFRNSQNDRIIDSSPAFFNGNLSSFTTSIWVRWESNTTATLLSYAATGSPDGNEYMFWYNPSGSRIQSYVNDVGNDHVFALGFNRWYNIVNVIDSTSNNLYVDGVLVSSKAQSNPGYVLRENGYFVIGQDQDTVGGGFDITQDLIGDVGSLQIYNRALSLAEVKQNYDFYKDRYKNIVTSGLVLNLDAGNDRSYAGTGTIWYDITDNTSGITGILTNGATYSSDNGGIMTFDGVNDYVSIEHATRYKVQFPLTIGMFFQMPAATYQVNFVTDNTSSLHRGIWLEVTNNVIQASYGNGTANSVSGRRTYGATGYSLLEGEWYYLAAKFTDSTNCQIYLNGVPLTTTYSAGSATSLAYSTGEAAINRKDDVSDRYFKGSVSLAHIYNRGLTDAEILQNYDALKERFENPETIVTNGLVLNLDASASNSYPGSGTTWIDLSGNGHNATLVNGPAYDASYSGSIKFDGVNDYVSVTETSALRPQVLTLEVTFRINGTVNTTYGSAPSNYQYIAFRQNSRTNRFEGYQLFYEENSKRVSITASTAGGTQYGIGSTTDINVGDICTITAVFDNTTMSIYRNGILEASGPKAAGIDYNGSHALKLGRTVPSGGDGWDAAMNGDIYACRMYNRVLTADEILQNHNVTKERYTGIVRTNLSLFLDAGDINSYPGTGITWLDVSGNGNNATLINGPTYNSAYSGSIVFDGVDDYVDISDAPFRVNGTDFSAETIFYYGGGNVIDVLLAKRNPTSPFAQYEIAIYSGDPYVGGAGYVLTAFLRKDGGDTLTDRLVNYALPAAGIYHAAITNGSDALRLYVNGVLVATSTTSTGSATYNITGHNLRIGYNGNSNSYYGGKVYQTRFYTRQLTESQILQNYNATRKKFEIIPLTDLVLKLDAADSASYTGGSTWYDVSGNGNHATLVNSPTVKTYNGRNVLEFNGINQYGNVNSLNLRTGTSTIIFGGRYFGNSGIYGRVISNSQSPGNYLLGYHSATYDRYHADGWVNQADGTLYPRDSNWRIYTGTTNTTTDQYRLYNGTNLVASNSGGSAGTNGISIGYWGAGAAGGLSPEYSQCQVSFVLAYNRVLTDAEINQVVSSLEQRFARESDLLIDVDATNFAYYPENSWNDTSGYDNDFRPYNLTEQSNYLTFNGSNSYATSLGFDLVAPLTITAWVYKNSHRAWASILDRFTAELYDGLSFGFDQTTGERLMYMFNWNLAPPGNICLGNSIIGLNQWYHVTLTATSSSCTFYVNGVEDGTSASGQVTNRGDFIIGANFPGGDEYLDGRISRVRVYKRVLTANEIFQDYEATKDDYVNVVRTDLALLLDASDSNSYSGTGTTWYDISGNGNNATLVNGPTYNSELGGSLVLDGVDDYVDIADTPFRINGVSFSAEITFYFDGNNIFSPLYAKRNPSIPYNQWNFSISNGNPYAPTPIAGNVLLIFLRKDGGDTPTDRIATYTLPRAGIYHAAITNGSDALRLYVNGELAATSTTNVGSATYNITGSNLRIGQNYTSDYSNTRIYQAKFYTRQLSSNEVLQNFNASSGRYFFPVSSGLVALLDANDTDSYAGTGTTWYDISGNGNNATLVNGPTYDSITKSFALNGVNQYIAGLNASGLTNMTIELWVRDDRPWTTNEHDILTYNGNSGSYTFQNNISTFRTDGNFLVGRSFNVTIPAQSTWYRLCYVKNGDLWINNTKYTGAGSDRTYGTLNFGASRSSVNTFLQGRIGYISIYNRNLTDAEIQHNFNLSRGRFGI